MACNKKTPEVAEILINMTITKSIYHEGKTHLDMGYLNGSFPSPLT